MFFPIFFYGIGFIFLSIIFQKLRKRAEKRCDGITYYGQINFFSQCTIILEKRKIVINSDYIQYNEIEFENIKKIEPITLLAKFLIIVLNKNNGKKRIILLNINAPDLFLKEFQKKVLESSHIVFYQNSDFSQ